MGDALEKRIKTGQDRTQGRIKNIIADESVPMVRLKDGDHSADVIPYTAGKYDPLVDEGDPTYTYEYWAHPNVGPNNMMYLCLAEMFNKKCPICEHRQRLREKGADEKVWKALFPKRRNLYNIILYDKGEEEKGIQVFDVSWHYFEKHVMAISKKKGRHGKRDKTINFVHPKKGKCINWTTEPAKSKNDYPSAIGFAFDDRDYEIDDALFDDAFTLDEIVHIPEYDEVAEAYAGGDDKGSKKKESSKPDDSSSDILEELDEIVDGEDDLDDVKEDLKEFIENYELDVKIKKRMDLDDAVEAIKEAIEERSNEPGDDDDDDDDNELSDEEKEELIDKLEDMNTTKLKRFIKKNNLEVDPDDADDEDELREMIMEEMGLEE